MTRDSGHARTEHFDVVIIGTGAGGGTMARALASTGRRILVLERGGHFPRHADNWDPGVVWVEQRYRAKERWLTSGSGDFQPNTHYGVGGNTKFWGSVLYRLRREDFGAVRHLDGQSPAWPIDYDTLAPYHDRAERLYSVHGEAGADPTDPPRGPFPYAPIPHARVAELNARAACTLYRRSSPGEPAAACCATSAIVPR